MVSHQSTEAVFALDASLSSHPSPEKQDELLRALTASGLSHLAGVYSSHLMQGPSAETTSIARLADFRCGNAWRTGDWEAAFSQAGENAAFNRTAHTYLKGMMEERLLDTGRAAAAYFSSASTTLRLVSVERAPDLLPLAAQHHFFRSLEQISANLFATYSIVPHFSSRQAARSIERGHLQGRCPRMALGNKPHSHRNPLYRHLWVPTVSFTSHFVSQLSSFTSSSPDRSPASSEPCPRWAGAMGALSRSASPLCSSDSSSFPHLAPASIVLRTCSRFGPLFLSF